MHLLGDNRLVNVSIADGVINNIGPELAYASSDYHVDADGGLLLPGLHDHHIHLMAFAASLDSLQCGPPAIQSEAELATALRASNAESPPAWLRGIAYHPCVAGDIDRTWLDRHIPERPVRIQHRGGRLWVLNSKALEALGAYQGDTPAGLEQMDGRFTGRLYEGDIWLRRRLKSRLPDLSEASKQLAGFGITGITDTTPTNGAVEWTYFAQCQDRNELRQSVRMMGGPQIHECSETASLTRGEFKIHLLESRLPELDSMRRDIEAAHAANRGVAIHCVTITELVFALSALETAGVHTGDRIEHASVCPPHQMHAIRELGLRVVTQPHFIAERGDQYLSDVEAADLPWLYRAATYLAEGIPLAGGSDAPFGNPDPWRAMQAAVERNTASGNVIGQQEALAPEQALRLFLSPPDTPGIGDVRLRVGSRADLCLLHEPWERVREQLTREQVHATWRLGELIYRSQ